MVQLIERSRTWLVRWISKRVPVVPAKHRRRLLGVGALILALVAAVWAQGLARRSALSEWERSRPPSEKVWTHALGSRGYVQLGNPQAIQRVTRTLPLRMDSENQVWISGDSLRVVLFSDPMRVYCRDCLGQKMNENWEPMGAGWSAFDPVLERIDALPVEKPLPARAAAKIPHDPRQILY